MSFGRSCPWADNRENPVVGYGCQPNRRHCQTVGASRTERSAARQAGDTVEWTKVLRRYIWPKNRGLLDVNLHPKCRIIRRRWPDAGTDGQMDGRYIKDNCGWVGSCVDLWSRRRVRNIPAAISLMHRVLGDTTSTPHSVCLLPSPHHSTDVRQCRPLLEWLHKISLTFYVYVYGTFHHGLYRVYHASVTRHKIDRDETCLFHDWSTACSAFGDVRVINRRKTRFSRYAWPELGYGWL